MKSPLIRIALGCICLGIFCVLAIFASGLVPAWILVILAFTVGALTILGMPAKAPTFESYLDSDWRHFERLIELSPEQIAKLQSLTRRPELKGQALEWIDAHMALKEGGAEEVLQFFVTSGWASGGMDPDHAKDAEWRWGGQLE